MFVVEVISYSSHLVSRGRLPSFLQRGKVMRIASVVLSIVLCGSALGQSRQAEATIRIHAGLGEQLVTSCRAIDEVERAVGSTMSTKDLLEEFKKSGTCLGF